MLVILLRNKDELSEAKLDQRTKQLIESKNKCNGYSSSDTELQIRRTIPFSFTPTDEKKNDKKMYQTTEKEIL